MIDKLEEIYTNNLNKLKEIVSNIYSRLKDECDYIVIGTKMDIVLIGNVFASLYPEVTVNSNFKEYCELGFKDFYITISTLNDTTIFKKYKYVGCIINDEEDFLTNEEIIRSIKNDIISSKASIRSIIRQLITYLLNINNELVINEILDLRVFNPELWRVFNYGEIQFPEAGRYLWANTDDDWQFIVFEKLIISIQIDQEKKTTTISRLIHGLKDTLIWATCYKDR